MATIKIQKANGDWEYIQLVGEDVGGLANRVSQIESFTHSHNNKQVLDKLSVNTDGNLLFNGENISTDNESSIVIQDTKPEDIVFGRIWIDTSEDDEIDTGNSEDLSEVISKIDSLKSESLLHNEDINSEQGRHGIRYFENKLSIKVNGKWIEFTTSSSGSNDDTNGGGSSVDGSGLALDGVSRFTIEVASGKNVLYWTEPEKNILINGQVVASWSGTRVLRKVGSFPIDERDGVLVVDSRVHNQYAKVGFVDEGLTNGTEYYYSILPYTNYGTFSEKKNAKGKPTAQKIYGVRIDKDNSDSDKAVSYIKDAEGFSPMSLKNSILNWGSWKDIFDNFKIKPCLLLNGNVNYYLNPNDYTKKEDKTISDMITGNDGDVMVEFGKTLWWKFTDEGNLSYTVEISDMAFEGAVKHAFEIEEGYNILNYFQFMLIQVLYVIFFKSINGSVVGISGGTGVGHTQGLFGQTKILGIEGLFYYSTFLDGAFMLTDNELTLKKKDFGTTDYSDSTHLKVPIEIDKKYVSSYGYYFTKVQATNEGGFIAKYVDGGSTTYYRISVSLRKNLICYISNSVFGVNFYSALTNGMYSRLSYVRNGRIYIGVYANTLINGRYRSLSNYNPTYATFAESARLSKLNNDLVI